MNSRHPSPRPGRGVASCGPYAISAGSAGSGGEFREANFCVQVRYLRHNCSESDAYEANFCVQAWYLRHICSERDANILTKSGIWAPSAPTCPKGPQGRPKRARGHPKRSKRSPKEVEGIPETPKGGPKEQNIQTKAPDQPRLGGSYAHSFLARGGLSYHFQAQHKTVAITVLDSAGLW